MAVTYESISSTNFSTSEVASQTITKPTGLAEGDLMLGFFGKSDTINSSDSRVNLPSGWTSVESILFDGNDAQVRCGFKVADSSDVAASNFTFTANQNCHLGGVILRFSDPAASDVVSNSASDSTTSGTTTSFTIDEDVRTDDALCVICFMGIASSGGGGTLSGFTSTPSLTWTEVADFENTSAGNNPVLGAAVSNQTDEDNFTAFGATFSASQSARAGIFVILNTATSASADISHLAITPTVESVTGSNTANADISHLAITPALENVTGKSSSDTTRWTEPTKEDTTWTNKNI